MPHDHSGDHVSAWKSEIDRQRRVLVRNRPDGVKRILLLLLPWTRELIYRLLARNLRVVEVSANYRRPDDPELIDLDRSDWRDGPSL